MPLLWEAYYSPTMRANWLRPKADAEAALNIIQERFSRAESGRRLGTKESRHGKSIGGEEVRAGRWREKRSCIILIRKDSRSCLKSFFTSTSTLLPRASSSGGRQQAGLACRAASSGHCCYHDNWGEQVLEALKKLLCELLEVGRGGAKAYWMNPCCTPG